MEEYKATSSKCKRADLPPLRLFVRHPLQLNRLDATKSKIFGLILSSYSLVTSQSTKAPYGQAHSTSNCDRLVYGFSQSSIIFGRPLIDRKAC